MTNHKNAIVALILTLVSVSGCGTSPQPRLYLLEATEAKTVLPDSPVSVTIGIGPISLPSRLDRKTILSRHDRYRASVSELDRWAEPLDEGLAAVLAKNLSTLIPTDRIVIYPWQMRRLVDYSVKAQVLDFEVVPGGNAELSIVWAISNRDGEVLKLSKSRHIQSVATDEPLAVVAALSATVGELSKEIALAIRSLVVRVATQ